MSRELALSKELENLKKLNASVDSLLASVQKVNTDVTASKKATDNSAALLEDWVQILNQTRFVSESLRNPEWKGTPEAETDDATDASLSRERQIEAELSAMEAENDRLATTLHSGPSPKRTPKRARH
ncbi:hypothetical protein JCM33374_g4064 [Metschnikowia sp. JCM 33374]|nr:hypothetical protein JCM33374_g4064 [Metschnikowia sp. JCM 33374]